MNWYIGINLHSHLDLFYQIAVKNIDLKELKEFKVMGDKIEAAKTGKDAYRSKTGCYPHQQLWQKKMLS